mgnify:CR=1 FL=1
MPHLQTSHLLPLEASYHNMTIGRIPSVEGGIQPTIVDAKGDLIAATAADSVNRLAVGSNDQVLVADSSTSTGLAWKSYAAQFVAGKNKIINGDFNINQRAFSSTTTSGNYGLDRFYLIAVDGTTTYSVQQFTAGAAPVSGYESKQYARLVTTGQTASTAVSALAQNIESVRTFAGQTVTLSFWAKAASGTPKVAIELQQTFGTGGSPSGDVNTYAGQVTLSTSWARYSVTVAIPSISGKTLGSNNNDALSLNMFVSAGSNYNSRTGSLGIQTGTFDFWGVQLEAGSVATPFTTATGTLQGELAACQRYFQQHTIDVAYGTLSNYGTATSTTSAEAIIPLKVTMRIKPATLTYANLAWNSGVAVTAITSAALAAESSTQFAYVTGSVASGLTQYRPYALSGNNNSAAYIGISAEL